VLKNQRLFNQYTAILSLSYEIDVWGRIHSATDASLAELLAEVQARRAVVLTLIASVATGYIQLRQFDKQLEIANETYKSRVDSLKLAEVRFKEGLTSDLEVQQAASEVQSALVEVKQLEISIPKTENQLCVLLGITPQKINRGISIDKLSMPAYVPPGLPSDLLENRPDILEAEQILSATVSRVGEARAAMFPQISLTGAYGNQSSELHQLLTAPSRVWDYGISILTPVFDAGRLAYTVDVAIAQRQEALYKYFQVILNAFAEVNTALIAHQKTKELVQVLTKQVQVLSEYLHLAVLRYDNGQTDYLNVLDAERTLFASQLDLAAAQSEAFTTLIQLYAALGGGWVIDADYGLPCQVN
jgi:multidrug efflux system outer membrane protein